MSDNLVNMGKMRILVNELNRYTKLYDEGHPAISDKEWDDKYFELLLLEQEIGNVCVDSPTQRVSYQVVNELEKVKHNHPMLSLDKTKNWDTFFNYFGDKEAICMPKLDGLTCSLRYLNGKLVSAETRGNGEIGENILHNALVIKSIPKKINFKEELIIDGEILCDYVTFKAFEEEYANPRNFASGSIRLLDNKECSLRHLTFIAWNIVNHPWGNSFFENMIKLYNLGFKIAPMVVLTNDCQEFSKQKFGYPIDGLVARFDDIAYGESLGTTGHHSRAAYAFKFYDEEYKTWLKDIEWTMGRTGQLTPVAVFNPVDTGDSIIERANLHNISIMKKLLGTPYHGQTICVYKANDIIPQIASGGIPETKADILGLEFDIPTICPICGGETKIVCEVDTEVLMCTNELCAGKLINRLDHFAGKKGLDIKGLSKATLEKLIDWGWVVEPCDIYKLNNHAAEWKTKPGFGEKSVENILSAIENSRFPKLENFISAIGIPFIGRTLSRELVKVFPTYETFRAAVKEHYDFTTIEGIGYEKAVSLWNFDYSEVDQVDDFILAYTTNEKEITNTLDKESICITGKLKNYKNRDELAAAIRDHGGKVVSSVSSNTTYLINNDINSTSAKNTKAKSLNIPIITEEEFVSRFLAE